MKYRGLIETLNMKYPIANGDWFLSQHGEVYGAFPTEEGYSPLNDKKDEICVDASFLDEKGVLYHLCWFPEIGWYVQLSSGEEEITLKKPFPQGCLEKYITNFAPSEIPVYYLKYSWKKCVDSRCPYTSNLTDCFNQNL